ncbi:conserved hypothetical protein [Ferroglobus placidus DSM 10642]|uniref:Uncharacterized protein n=1 Tax=Ferroglobus placidus (strain DSM 10642 / AEDII12DO) TaxID=589924 RepID=D3S3G1_FERPA|nr:hypothetical protein [Ferroglobus placidus]ADC64794.1 conserved hypothetical protein [Ferroglobus placidus DSM 10642]
MDEFEEYIEIYEVEEDEFEEDDERLAEIYRLFVKLLNQLENLKSFELKEAASLMMIKELVNDDKVLAGLATKMLQDMIYNLDEDSTYSS